MIIATRLCGKPQPIVSVCVWRLKIGGNYISQLKSNQWRVGTLSLLPKCLIFIFVFMRLGNFTNEQMLCRLWYIRSIQSSYQANVLISQLHHATECQSSVVAKLIFYTLLSGLSLLSGYTGTPTVYLHHNSSG